MDVRDIQNHLRVIGWPIAVDGSFGPTTKKAVMDFQAGWTNVNLAVDGAVGPLTEAALRGSVAFGGACAPSFFYREFKSRGNGWIKVNRELLRGLVRYRALIGRPVPIVSGHRDPAYNKKIGGASQSQHLFGTGVDINPVVSVARVRSLGAFSGIGHNPQGLVRHVDVRHVDRGINFTGGQPGAPTVWRYGN